MIGVGLLMGILAWVAAAAEAATPTAAEAAAAYDRLKALNGDWEGKSTKGWTDRVQVKTIAAGSVVVFDSFDAHPNEEMLTTFAPDGDRLLLTHYCVARNQPRLVLSAVENEGRRLTFTFLDGGNLPSRDRGHMDSLVLDFPEPGRFTERWTWYQDGKESFMEEIEMRRASGP